MPRGAAGIQKSDFIAFSLESLYGLLRMKSNYSTVLIGRRGFY
jgi:hypothetical protein